MLPNPDRLEYLVVFPILKRVSHLVLEVVRNTIQIEAILGIQIVVTSRGHETTDRLRLRIRVHRRATIRARFGNCPRRLEVMNLGDYFTLRAIIFGRLTRKSQQNVVEIVDAVVGGPLDQLEVAHPGRMLLHQLENVRRETLNTRLNREQTTLAHVSELHA